MKPLPEDRPAIRAPARLADEAHEADGAPLAPEGVCRLATITLSPEGSVTSCNLDAYHITGWSADELIGRQYCTLFSGDRAGASPSEIIAGAARYGFYAGECWRVRKDGAEFPARVQLTAMRNASGDITGFVETISNISSNVSSNVGSDGSSDIGDVASNVAGQQTAAAARSHDTLQREAEQAKLLDVAREAIIHRDVDGVISFWSKGAERMYGLSASEAKGKNAHDLLKTQFPLPFAELLARLRADGYWEGELIHTCKDGREIIVESSWVTHETSAGLKILEINNDITGRKRAEELLLRTQERLETAQRAASIGSWDTDVATGTVWWSKETYSIFGVPEGTPITLDRFFELVHPDDRQRVREHAMNVRASMGTYEVDHRIVRPDETERYLREHATMFLADQGHQHMVGIVQDITEQRDAETALRESEAQLRATFEQAAVGMGHVDLDGRWMRINQRLSDITGYSVDELLKMRFQEITYPDDLEADLAHTKQLLNGTQDTYSMEKRYIRKDGSIIWVNLTAALKRDHGRPEYYIVVVEDINKRKEAEAALRESEQLLRELADAMPQIVFSSRPDGTIDYYNRRWYEYTGFSPETAGGWASILHPEDAERTTRLWRDSMRTGAQFQIECRFKDRRSGGYRWFLGRALPVLDGSRIIRWFGTCTDIDDQKRAEAAILEKEERFRTLAETLPEMIWTCSNEGNCEYISAQWTKYTGTSASENLGKGWIQVLHPDDRDPLNAAWRAASASGTPFAIDYRVRGADGQYRLFRARGTPIRDEWGNVAKWVGSSTDVEEERRITDRLRFLARISDIIEQSAEESSLADGSRLDELARVCVPFLADWCAIDLLDNGRLRRVAVGCVNEQAGGRSLGFAKDPARPSMGIGAVLRAGKPRFFPEAGDDALKILARGDEHLAFLKALKIRSVIIVPLIARGKPLGVISFTVGDSGRQYCADDLAFTIEIARRLAIAIDNALLYSNAKKALALRDDFLSIASHELKTPVTSIKAFLQALEKRMERPQSFDFAKNREYMQLSVRQVDRLASLISDLLDINRINKGTMEYHFTTAPIGPVIAEVVERMSVSFPTHQMALWLEDLTSKVKVDHLRFEQVLTNLITNAVKYSPPGSTVDIVMRREGRKVHIGITDRGIGIPEAHQEYIFDQYYRAPGAISTRVGGLGIGLFISSQLIKAHGGTLSVRSEQGKGSTFTITLPALE
jgi:PAS domain S-box-containing protein